MKSKPWREATSKYLRNPIVLVLGLVALGVYLNGANLRVLKAVEMLKDTLRNRTL